MNAVLVSPAEGRFVVVSATPPPPQKQNEGVSNLTVALPGKVEHARIVVVLTAEGDAPREVEGLDRWVEAGKMAR